MSSTKRSWPEATEGDTLSTVEAGDSDGRLPDLTFAPDMLAAGEKVARYEIIGVLGMGGMGVVYEAQDPELGRRIALKLLRVGGEGSTGRARLLREARALAQLNHPNVISIYDVGAYEGDVWVAIELVEGMTLRDWLDTDERSVSQILRVFAAAGRGLEAAHRVGLVHRDVKPSNILLGDDGRVRMIDFGLARAPALADSTTVESELVEGGESWDSTGGAGPLSVTGERDCLDTPAGSTLSGATPPLNRKLTRAGHLAGTPAYMSPEQSRGGDVGAQSDQFSFAVALYEALYDRRPFRGAELGELRQQQVDGALRKPPVHAGVSPALRRAICRALAPRPADRFPSLSPLIAELDKDPRRRRRRILGAAGGIALAGVAVAVGAMVATGEPPCEDSDAELATVWNDDVRAAIGRAFERSGLSYADATFDKLATSIDDYAREWTTMHTETCRATRVDGTQSEITLDRRMRCLARRRAELDALTRRLNGDLSAKAVRLASDAAARLGDLKTCEDIELVNVRFPPPTAPKLRSRVDALWTQLAEVDALVSLGDVQAAMQRAQEVLPQARQIEHPPLTAAMLVTLGRIQGDAGEYADAEETLDEGIQAAAVAADDRLGALAWVHKLWALHNQGRADEAILLESGAAAAVARAGSPPQLRGELESALATLTFAKGDYVGAAAKFESAVAQFEKAGPRYRRELGRSLTNLATAYSATGKTDEALDQAKEALAIANDLRGPGHPDIADALYVVGYVHSLRGELDRAIDLYRQTYELRQSALGDDNPLTAQAAQSVGSILGRLGRPDEARTYLLTALATAEKTKGSDHPDLAYALENIAGTLLLEKKPREALDYQRRALAVRREGLGSNHPLVASSLQSLAGTYIEVGDREAALKAIEEALEVDKGAPLPAGKRASLHFLAAQVLSEQRDERTNARRLATSAIELFESVGDETGARQARTWLAAR